MSYFQIFGSGLFVPKPYVKRKGKFDIIVEEGTLVGYCQSNAYQVIVLDDRTFVESKNVKILKEEIQMAVTVEKYT